jgi:hypothetical protein
MMNQSVLIALVAISLTAQINVNGFKFKYGIQVLK